MPIAQRCPKLQKMYGWQSFKGGKMYGWQERNVEICPGVAKCMGDQMSVGKAYV